MTTTTEYATWVQVHGIDAGTDPADNVRTGLANNAEDVDVDGLIGWYVDTINDRLPDGVHLVGQSYFADIDVVPHLTHEQLRDAEPGEDEYAAALQARVR